PVDGQLWGDVVEMAPASEDSFACTGAHASGLPPDPKENLVLRVRALFEAARGPLPPLRVTLEKGLPLRSGLGSSSASIVAALVAYEAVSGSAGTRAELLGLAGLGEGLVAGAPHTDNVAPCLLGGMRLVTDGRSAEELPFPDDLRFVVAHPELE